MFLKEVKECVYDMVYNIKVTCRLKLCSFSKAILCHFCKENDIMQGTFLVCGHVMYTVHTL